MLEFALHAPASDAGDTHGLTMASYAHIEPASSGASPMAVEAKAAGSASWQAARASASVTAVHTGWPSALRFLSLLRSYILRLTRPSLPSGDALASRSGGTVGVGAAAPTSHVRILARVWEVLVFWNAATPQVLLIVWRHAPQLSCRDLIHLVLVCVPCRPLRLCRPPSCCHRRPPRRFPVKACADMLYRWRSCCESKTSTCAVAVDRRRSLRFPSPRPCTRFDHAMALELLVDRLLDSDSGNGANHTIIVGSLESGACHASTRPAHWPP